MQGACYGTHDAGGQAAGNTETLFSVTSVSKVITAINSLGMVANDTLTLD